MRLCARARLLQITGLLLIAGLLLGAMMLMAACGSGQGTDATPASDGAAVPDGASTDGAAATDEATTRGIEVKGLVDEPGTLAPVDLEAMVLTTMTADNPEKGPTEYTGSPFGELTTTLGVQPGATAVILTGADGSTAEISLADMDADAMLAFDDDGTYDAVMPGMDATAWVSDVVSMDFR